MFGSAIVLESLCLLQKLAPVLFQIFPFTPRDKIFKGERDQEKEHLEKERQSAGCERVMNGVKKTYSFLHSITGGGGRGGGELSHRSSTDWPFNNHVHKSYGAKLDLAHLTKNSLIFNPLEEDSLKVLF